MQLHGKSTGTCIGVAIHAGLKLPLIRDICNFKSACHAGFKLLIWEPKGSDTFWLDSSAL